MFGGGQGRGEEDGVLAISFCRANEWWLLTKTARGIEILLLSSVPVVCSSERKKIYAKMCKS